MSLKPKAVLGIGLPILLTVLASYYLQGAVLSNQKELTLWLANFGPYVILIYIFLQVLTIIIAPIGGFFLVVAMIALFGPAFALTLAYLVATPCYLLNFYLARKFGQPFVGKILGHETLKKIDHYVQDAGVLTLVVLRLFQGGNFDYFSYGLGLTKIPFKTFAYVTFLAGIPGTYISYIVLSRFENLTSGIIALYITTAVLTGISIYLNHHIKKHRRNR